MVEEVEKETAILPPPPIKHLALPLLVEQQKKLSWN
jgi:hypothetical protein